MNSYTPKIACLLIVLSFINSKVSANSVGVPVCDAGIASINNANPTNTHIIGKATVLEGTLADRGVTLTIDGTALSGAATVSAGSQLEWTLVASDAALPMKGIFIRIESTAEVMLDGDTTLLKTNAICSTLPGVYGLDHISAAPKASVSGSVTFMSAGTATVDVTTVFDNILTSNYAYTGFQLTIEESAVPVDAPVTVPVDTPVAVPVDTPVDVPVDTPVATSAPAVGGTPAPAAAAPVTVPAPVVDGTEPPTVDGEDECPEDSGKGMGMGKGKGKGGDDDDGSGKGMGKMSGKMMMGMKCKKAPKEPKTPKAGKGKGSEE